MKVRYPAMGLPKNAGFPAFLGERMGAPGVNLRAFREDVRAILRSAQLSLVDSGASAALVAALTLADRCGISFQRTERPTRRTALASAFAHPSTISALCLAGFDVTLVDTERDGFNVSPEAVARAITDDVAMVCVTHFLGFPARIDLVADAAAGKRVSWILQDASDTLGLRVAGYPIHAWAALTTYSFDHERHLSTYGGGAIATDDKGLATAVESIATGGNACTHDAPFYEEDTCEAPLPEPDHRASTVRQALSVPMSDLDACYGLWSLESYPSDQRRRAVHYGVFYETLSQHPKLAVYADPFSGSTPFVFPIRVRSGDARPLAERLLARGIEVQTPRGAAIAEQPAFAHVKHDGLPACRAMTASCLVLSIHPSLPTEDVETVAEIVAEEATKC